jgi:4-hydroxymandelate oxidase
MPTTTPPNVAPAQWLNLHEYEAAAKAVLPSPIFDFVAGGSGDEVTLREAPAAFDRWRLVPRVMQGLHEVSTASTVLGLDVSMPVLIAPFAAHRLCHDEGECATARAARSARTIFTLATPSTVSMEDVGRQAGTWWFQLYIFRDRGLTRELVRRASDAGASAIVVTLDMPIFGRREADERNRFTLPPGLEFVHMPKETKAPSTMPGSRVATAVNSIFESALTWKDLEWLASLSPLPVVAKGILHADDAVRAIEHGARAISVSNHGGRQLDSAVAALDVLPEVVEAVGQKVDVLVDGGVRRGADVLKALALGARAVMIGRPVAWGLALDGERGVLQALELLRGELERDLVLCGRGSPGAVDRSLVRSVTPPATVRPASFPR